jgi:hypothetical protein
MLVKNFIEALNTIGYDDQTELEFDTVDGSTGEVYDLKLKEFCYGDDLCVPNVNSISVELKVADDFIKDKSREYVDELAEELNDVLNKYR